MALIEETRPGGLPSGDDGIQPIQPESNPDAPNNVTDETTEIDDGSISETVVNAPKQNTDDEAAETTTTTAEKPVETKPATETPAATQAAAAAPSETLIDFHGLKLTPQQLVAYTEELIQGRAPETAAATAAEAPAMPAGVIPPPPQLTQEQFDALDPVSQNTYRWMVDAHNKSVEAAQVQQQRSQDEKFWGSVKASTSKAVAAHIDTDPMGKNVGGTLRNLLGLAIEQATATIRAKNPRLGNIDAHVDTTVKQVAKELRDYAEAYHQNITAERIKTQKATLHQASGGQAPRPTPTPKKPLDVDDTDSVAGSIVASLRRHGRR